MAWVFKNVATGFVVDSNIDGQAYTQPENGGSYQKWFLEGARLRNVATNKSLDSN